MAKPSTPGGGSQMTESNALHNANHTSRTAIKKPLGFDIRLALVSLLVAMLSAGPLWADQQEALDVEDLKAFSEAWGRIKNHYIVPVNDRVLLEAAIRGMVNELDRHSDWLNEAEFQRLEDQALGQFGGLGIRIAIQPDTLQIVEVRPSSPAALAGLEAGDEIIEIDGQTIDGNSQQSALSLRGPVDSVVELAVRRTDAPELRRVELTRAIIKQDSVFWRSLPDAQRLIRIDNFQQTTASELDRALEAMLADDTSTGIVLDLRNNPGGMVQAAVAVADRFLDDGLIVQSNARDSAESRRYQANPGQVLEEIPIAILINKRTASSAEILAAALRDHGRAIVIGEPSYGKGSVQTIWPLSNGSAIRLTSARYRTPNGLNLEGAGVIPDIRIPYEPDRLEDAALVRAQLWLRERMLDKEPAIDASLIGHSTSDLSDTDSPE